MKHTKKIIIGILVMLMGFTAILTLAACGGAPSYVSNPPENATELIEKLEKNSWKVDDCTVDGIGDVYAMKIFVNGKIADANSEEPKDSDKIVYEKVMIGYFATVEEANAIKTTTDEEQLPLKKIYPRALV